MNKHEWWGFIHTIWNQELFNDTERNTDNTYLFRFS